MFLVLKTVTEVIETQGFKYCVKLNINNSTVSNIAAVHYDSEYFGRKNATLSFPISTWTDIGIVISALHEMPARTSDEKGFVCLSVRPSDKRLHCDKMEERSVQIFLPYERSFSLVF